jgi:hypothetical protein
MTDAGRDLSGHAAEIAALSYNTPTLNIHRRAPDASSLFALVTSRTGAEIEV